MGGWTSVWSHSAQYPDATYGAERPVTVTTTASSETA